MTPESYLERTFARSQTVLLLLVVVAFSSYSAQREIRRVTRSLAGAELLARIEQVGFTKLLCHSSMRGATSRQLEAVGSSIGRVLQAPIEMALKDPINASLKIEDLTSRASPETAGEYIERLVKLPEDLSRARVFSPHETLLMQFCVLSANSVMFFEEEPISENTYHLRLHHYSLNDSEEKTIENPDEIRRVIYREILDTSEVITRIKFVGLSHSERIFDTTQTSIDSRFSANFPMLSESTKTRAWKVDTQVRTALGKDLERSFLLIPMCQVGWNRARDFELKAEGLSFNDCSRIRHFIQDYGESRHTGQLDLTNQLFSDLYLLAASASSEELRLTPRSLEQHLLGTMAAQNSIVTVFGIAVGHTWGRVVLLTSLLLIYLYVTSQIMVFCPDRDTLPLQPATTSAYIGFQNNRLSIVLHGVVFHFLPFLGAYLACGMPSGLESLSLIFGTFEKSPLLTPGLTAIVSFLVLIETAWFISLVPARTAIYFRRREIPENAPNEPGFRMTLELLPILATVLLLSLSWFLVADLLIPGDNDAFYCIMVLLIRFLIGCYFMARIVRMTGPAYDYAKRLQQKYTFRARPNRARRNS